MDKYNIIKEEFEIDPYSDHFTDDERQKIVRDKIAKLNLDPTIAIISDDIKSDEELNRIYKKFTLLPRKFRRFSNYYSTQLLGYNVPNMYAIMRDKLITNDYIFEGVDYEVLNEKFIGSEPDLYYNQKKFNDGETNICFILGHSGSGKSMMASSLKGKAIDHIELDDLLLVKDHFSIKELKEYSNMMYSFFTGVGKKYYIGIKERDNFTKEQYEDKVFVDFVKYAMNYAKSHKNRKFIIEGVWIYLYFNNPAIFKDYAVFIKGTSFLKSKIRAAKREAHRDKETLKDRRKMFSREFRNYLLDENKINKYRKYFENLPETIKKEENKVQKESAVIILNERLIGSQPDLYYNKKAFDSGDINLCFVIGYSGSGKSYLTKNYKGDNIERVELDDIVCIKDHKTLTELKESCPLMYSFFSGTGKKYYLSREERKESKEHKNVFHDFITYAERYANSHKNEKFILEGIWTYLFFDNPGLFDKYAVYMKGTSLIKSKIRRMKRELKGGKSSTIKKIKEFGVYMTDSILHDNRIDKWYKYFEKKPETIIKKENGEIVKVKEATMEALNLIDNYFVNENQEGIIGIMNHTNDEIPVQEKAMIIEECKMALSDLQNYNLIDEFNIVPWFTLSEGYSDISLFEDKEYGAKVAQAMREYTYIPSEENRQKVLDLGWNPSVPLTEDSKNYAKERQKNWFRENNKSIQDLLEDYRK